MTAISFVLNAAVLTSFDSSCDECADWSQEERRWRPILNIGTH